jgi:NitT/TauT family transport system substrate-binding protein
MKVKVLLVVAMVAVLALIAAQCGAAPAPETITVVETVVVVETVEVEVEGEPQVVEKEVVKEVEVEVVVTATPEAMAEAEDTGPIPLDFRLNWTLYGEHAPFFVGVDKGFYLDEGLDVNVMEGSGSSTTVKLIGNGTNIIGYADSGTMMQGVTRGVPVKAVAVLLQTSPMSFIFKADKPIKTMEELKGKSIAITAGDASLAQLSALLSKHGMTEEDIQLVVVANPAGKETAILEDQADTFMGYYIDQPMRMEKNTGVDLDWTTTQDIGGVTTVSSAIIVSDRTIDEDPELVEKFVRATQRAVQYSIDNPEEAAEIFAKHAADFGFDKELSLAEILGAQELLWTENSAGNPVGWSAVEDWQASQDLLQEYAELKPEEDLNVYYTNEFISEPPYEPAE